MRTYEISIDVEVQDRHELYEAAFKRACESGTPEDEARAMLSYEDGDVNISACLIMMLDPGLLAGCSILQSSCD